jgi:hypothetical protein
VSEGTRTPGIQDHNLALYQLSYTHQGDYQPGGSIERPAS